MIQARIILLILVLLFPAAATAARELPDLGDPSAAWLTPDQEYRLGRSWLRALRGRVPILSDPVIQDYVEHLVYRLASHSDLVAPDLAVVVVDSREINAFAVPGGVIGINAGLLLHAGSEDELAAVIAHELAHVSQRHFARRYADSKRVNQMVLAALLASIAVAIAGDPQAGMAGMAATQAAAMQSQLAYSRHHEREADRKGMQTLTAAGMDPGAMPRFFERLQRQRLFATSPPEFLLTHPVTEERISDSRSRAEGLPVVVLRDSLAFQLIRARVQARYLADAAGAVDYFRNHYQQGHSHYQQALGYGLAISALRNSDYELARQTLHELLENTPDQYWLQLALAEVAEAQGDAEEAARIARDVHDLLPGNYATSVLLARNLIAAGDSARARPLLERLLRSRSDDPLLWRLMADSWGRQDPARAHFARGEHLFAMGADREAIKQLEFALKYSGDRFALHSQIRARIQQIEELSQEKF